MERYFEKISFEQFKKDIKNDELLYNEYNIPTRSTISSAGYDFEVIENYLLKPNETLKIPTGIKVKLHDDEMLMLVIRSSVGFKYNVRLTNQVGIVESDYHNNISNEGHIWISIQNEGKSDFIINKGNKICQGIFVKFLTVDNEKITTNIRQGGLGSTDKGEN